MSWEEHAGWRQITILVGCWVCCSTALARPGAPPVIVRGATACPTPREIGAALVGLLPRDPSQAAPDVLQVMGGEETSVDGGGSGETSGGGGGSSGAGGARGGAGAIRLVLTNAAGAPIARRSLLAGAASCAERARTVAVVVAAWEARMRAGAHPRMPAPSSSAALPAVASAAAAPAAASKGETPGGGSKVPAGAAALLAQAAIAGGTPGVAPVPPAEPVMLSPRPDPPLPAPRDGAGRRADVASASRRAGAEGPWSSSVFEVETGAAFLGSVTGGSAAPGALAEIALSRGASSWFSLGIGALAVGAHTVALTDTDAGGRGAWRRVGGVIDLRSRSTRWRAFELDLRAGLPLTALAIRGQSLPITSGATLFDLGMLAGVRVRTRLGQVAPFLELAGVVWPRTHTMYVGTSTSSTDLPAVEGWFSAGLSLIAERSRDR